MLNMASFCFRITNLPIIVKGILTAEDAEIAVDLGVAGIMVSNHGARQVDYVPASVSTYLPRFVLDSITISVGLNRF